MNSQTLLQPMVVLMLWTMVVWTYMYIRRLSLMRQLQIDPQSVAQGFDDPRSLPPAMANPPNNLRNLFEIPVLFYATVLALTVTGYADLDVLLAWAFVGLRILHSLIHITYNRVMHRFVAYVAGALVLWALVIRLALDLF